MARKKTAAPKHVEPEDENQDVEEPEAEETNSTSSHGKAMTKTEAIRRALAAGHEGPQDGTAYIRREFGIEVAPQHFSATKSQLKSREGSKKGKPGRKPREAAGPAESRPAASQAAPAGGDMIDDLAAVKHLVQKLGADQVRKIVGLFE